MTNADSCHGQKEIPHAKLSNTFSEINQEQKHPKNATYPFT